MATILMTLAEKKAPSKYEWFINFLTLGHREKIFNHIRRNYLQEEQLLLDGGCGQGRFLDIASSSWTSAIGVDLSKKMLQLAQKRFLIRRYHPPLIQASLIALPLKNNIFDIILCSFVLSELTHQQVQSVLKNFFECLKRNGLLILVTESKPRSKITRLIVHSLRFPAYLVAFTLTKTPKHPIHDVKFFLSRFNGKIIENKSFLGGFLDLTVIKKLI
ncbi:MAG: class I SAM-dependent methyltransferase [Candidatus Hodarchaeales archaeon]|jgi:ubiquinone/menaquinone biosynthesis C-methylase UbiE